MGFGHTTYQRSDKKISFWDFFIPKMTEVWFYRGGGGEKHHTLTEVASLEAVQE